MFRSATLLALVAVIGVSALATIHAITEDRIKAQQRRVVLEQLHQVFPSGDYDNALHEDILDIHDPVFFRHDGVVRVYRARKQGLDVGLVMNLVAPDGYNGDIRLLVAIRKNGQLTGVRVISHRETPGLGDPIEHERSDWIERFDHRSLNNPSIDGWAVKKDGGEFEQFTGATITPRAVVEAVQRALEYHSVNQEMLFEPAAVQDDHVPQT